MAGVRFLLKLAAMYACVCISAVRERLDGFSSILATDGGEGRHRQQQPRPWRHHQVKPFVRPKNAANDAAMCPS